MKQNTKYPARNASLARNAVSTASGHSDAGGKIRNTKSKGFTLLELMIVISLVGILVTLGTTGFLNSQKRGQDGRRQADMKTMQNSFEQYYAVNQVYPKNEVEAATQFPSRSLPKDPGTLGYTLTYDTANGLTYCACAQLVVSDGNANDASCTFSDTPPAGQTKRPYFCVNNLQ